MKLTAFLKKYWLVLLLAALVIFLLTGKSTDYDMAGKGGFAMPMMESAEESFLTSRSAGFAMADSAMVMDESTSESKVIRTANMGLHVSDVQGSEAEVTTVVTEMGGEVLSSSLWRGESAYSASMTLRVPEDQFSATLAALEDLAIYVNSQSVSADDVTEAYTDLEARLENARAEEAQYQVIMERANSVSEVLQVTESLSRVRYTIERYETQLQNYDRQVDYSTIYLSLSEDESVGSLGGKWRPGSTVTEAWKDFVVFLQARADDLIYLLVFGLPLAVVLGLVWLAVRKKR
jgi:virulence-associated protein VapD